MSAAVRLEDVRVVAGDRVLLDVPQLTIQQGERVGIVGPNGAGKSTLLKLIGAQVQARHGEVQVLGRSIGRHGDAQARGAEHALGRRERHALRRETGLLMQGLHLVPRLTARENVLVGALSRLSGVQAACSWARWYPSELVAEADAAMAVLGMAKLADTRVDRLSGGERQKVALARLQLQRPRLLLADEPTSALDPAATQEVVHALSDLSGESGRTMLCVVHDLELLPVLATRVIGMADGKLCWDRALSEVTPAMLQSLYGKQGGHISRVTSSGSQPSVRLTNV